MVDVSQFDLPGRAERGAWMQLIHPVTNEELGVAEGRPARIKLKGTDSMSYEQAVAHSVAMRGPKPSRGGKRPTTKDIMESANENAQLQSEQLAQITMAWENLDRGTDKNGKPVPLEFSYDSAVSLYMEQKWIRDQAVAFFGNRVNFAGKE